MKRKANMKYLLGLYYVSSTSMQINTAELQKTFCYELSPNRGPQGDMEKSDDLLEMTPLTGRAHTCEGGARSRDLSSVCPAHRTFLPSQRRGSTDSNDPISLDVSDSLREAMAITALQVRSRGSWHCCPKETQELRAGPSSLRQQGWGSGQQNFVVVQLLRHVWFFVTERTAARQASLSFTISWSLLTLMSIESVILSNHLILCGSLLLFRLLPSPLPSPLQSFTASGSFPNNQLSTSGGQSSGTSASVLPMNIQGWSPLGLTGLISCYPRVFSSNTIWKHQFFGTQPSLWSSSHICTAAVQMPRVHP